MRLFPWWLGAAALEKRKGAMGGSPSPLEVYMLRVYYGVGAVAGQKPNGQIRQLAVSPLPAGCDSIATFPKGFVPVALTVSLNCARPGDMGVNVFGK